MCGHGGVCKSKKLCLLIAYCLQLFVLWVPLFEERKHGVMEFGQLMTDIIVYVSCKFEMTIFEIAQVIGENVPITFLYVLSI